MKKIKKLVVAAIAATMLATTATTAFAAETSVAETITNQQAFKNALVSKVGVPDAQASEIATFITKVKLDDAKVDQIISKVDLALTVVGDKSVDEIKKDSDTINKLKVICSQVEQIVGGITVNIDTKTMGITITGVDENGLPDSNNVLLDLSQDDLSKIKGDRELSAIKALVSDNDIRAELKATAVVASSDPTGTYVDPSDPTDPTDPTEPVDPIPVPGEGLTDEEYKEIMAKAEAFDALLKEGDVDKLLAALNEFKEAVDKVKDEDAKAKLLAEYQKRYDILMALKNKGVSNINNTNVRVPSNTSLKTTATNNGNLAVAGLAMIAVAGTVFVVSKKKIAE